MAARVQDPSTAVGFDLASAGRFSALIWVEGEAKGFYLKSEKPQEVTLKCCHCIPSGPTFPPAYAHVLQVLWGK